MRRAAGELGRLGETGQVLTRRGVTAGACVATHVRLLPTLQLYVCGLSPGAARPCAPKAQAMAQLARACHSHMLS